MARSIMVTGASCTGKSTLIDMLVLETNIIRVPGYTTRERRGPERNGYDFFYLKSSAVFMEMFRNGRFIDPNFSVTMYADNFYGSPSEWVNMPNADVAILFSPTSTITASYIKRVLEDKILWVHLVADERVRKERLIRRGTPAQFVDVRLLCGDSNQEIRVADLNINTGNVVLTEIVITILNLIQEK